MARRRNINYIYGADLSNLEKAWKRIDRGMRRTAAQFERTGKTMTKAFTVPLAAIGGVAAKSAYDVDKALQKIARGTGAQGEDLKGLEKTWRSLAGTVTQSFEQSAQVLADYNTRLGITGDQLKNLSKQALDASRMLDEDVNNVVSQSAKAMQDWGVSIEDQTKFLDRLFRAAQSTGIQMGTLSTQLYKYGAGLRGMGFDLESSIALLAQFEKQGVNVEKIMGSLSMGLGRMAREGITDAEEAFKRLIIEIQNAENVTEATRLAIEVFGSRAGPDMALAIREGRFSVEELIATLREAEGAIADASERTKTFGDRWAETKNKVSLALEPIGREILNLAESVMPKLEAAVDKAATSIGEMSDETRRKILALAGVLAVGGPLLLAISATIKAISTLGGAFLALSTGPAAPIVLTIAAVWALIDAYKNLDAIQKKVTGMTPAEALDRSKYMERAGEIYHERYGKYPATAVDYKKLDEIIDELIAAEQKTRKATVDLGTQAQANIKGIAVDVAQSIQDSFGAIPDAADTTVSAVDRVTAAGERAMSVYERLAHQLDYVMAAEEYAWRYEAGPMPTSRYKEQEWDYSEMESAARIGASVAAEMDKVNQTLDVTTDKMTRLNIESQLWANNLVSGLADAIVYGRDLRSVLSDILRQLASSMLQKLLFGGLGGGGGGLFGGGLFGGLFHSGGVVGKSSVPMRLVPAGAFAGAPRLHNGLRPDEFPAILQRGETVLPRDAGTGGATSVKIVNVLDPSIVGNYLGTPEGEKVIVNIMQRNIRRIT